MNSTRLRRLLLLFSAVSSMFSSSFSYAGCDSLASWGNDSFRSSLLKLEPFQYDRLLSPFGNEPFQSVNAGVFRFGLVPYEHLLMRENNTLDLDTNLGVSEVNLVMGSKREQLLFLDHHQRITKNMRGRLSYNSIVSPGFLLNSIGRYQRISAGFDFEKGRVCSTIDFQYDRLSMDENGGVLPSQKIDGLSLADFEQLKTRLPDDRRLVRNWGLNCSNVVRLTNGGDSVFSNSPEKGVFLGLDAGWRRFGSSYTGLVDSSFYPIVYIDSAGTNDTSGFVKLFIAPSLSVRMHRGLFNFRLDAGSNFVEVRSANNGSDESAGYRSPFVSFFAKTGRLVIDSRIDWVLGNWFNQGDFSWQAGVGYTTGSWFLSGYGGLVQQSRIAPGLLLNEYASNQFRWSNEFSKETYSRVVGRLDFWNGVLSACVDAQQVNDWVFLDETAVPVQSGEAVSLVKSGIALNSGWRKWRFAFRVIHAAKNGSALRYPEWSAWSRVSYKAAFFKKALKAEVGCTVYGTAEYEAMSFMPLTGQTYLQSGLVSGGAPVVDAFFHAGLGKATLSLVVQRLNDGLFGMNYYLAPGYPAPPRTLKFVLRWRLFN